MGNYWMFVALKRKFPNLPHNVRSLGNGFYEVESRSTPGEHYNINITPLMQDPPKAPECPCKGYQVRKWCSHVDSAIAAHVRKAFQNYETAMDSGRRGD